MISQSHPANSIPESDVSGTGLKWSRIISFLAFVVAAAAAGFLLGRVLPRTQENKAAATDEPNPGIKCRPGPWGEVSVVPLVVAAPDDVLPVRTVEFAGTRWFFRGFSEDELTKLLTDAGVAEDLRAVFMDPAYLEKRADGILTMPPPSAVLALTPAARSVIHATLAKFPENNGQVFFLHKDTIEERFADSKVSADTVALFRRLCSTQRDHLVFSGLPALLSTLESYDEKKAFVKALTRQKTWLMRLRVRPESNCDELGAYWGRGVWSTDVRAMIESLSRVPAGTEVNVITMLPPLPSSQLYNYPLVQDTTPDGRPVLRDCHWSSLNFFKDKADDRFGADPAYTAEQIRTAYTPVGGDPRFGDLVLFGKPDGSIVHSAVYIADDFLFTKNGSTVIYPWMLAKLEDVTKHYSFQVAEGEHLTVSYYRSKNP